MQAARTTCWPIGGAVHRVEIDLIFADGDGLIFTEVKKSRSHDAALRNLSHRQQNRIYQAATEYLAGFRSLFGNRYAL
jgi:Holliday junction resolvase-like predicted endonuclease